MNKILILVVEDDRPVRNLIVTTLKTHDYKYLTAENGTTAIMEASSHQPDIILLDLGLPDMEGVDVIKKIRTWSNVPIIVISARSEDHDKIEALDAGADDYLTKPFHTSVLIQTAKALIRRNQIYSQASEARIHKGPFAVDTLKMECLKNGVSLNFTAREQSLFRFLLEHPGQVFTKAQLYSQVWNEAVVDDNTITVYIKRIRSKIEENPKEPKYLKTIRGIGYMLEV